jgi:hypothetical protein
MKAASFQYTQLFRICVVFYPALGKAKKPRFALNLNWALIPAGSRGCPEYSAYSIIVCRSHVIFYSTNGQP